MTRHWEETILNRMVFLMIQYGLYVLHSQVKLGPRGPDWSICQKKGGISCKLHIQYRAKHLPHSLRAAPTPRPKRCPVHTETPRPPGKRQQLLWDPPPSVRDETGLVARLQRKPEINTAPGVAHSSVNLPGPRKALPTHVKDDMLHVSLIDVDCICMLSPSPMYPPFWCVVGDNCRTSP